MLNRIYKHYKEGSRYLVTRVTVDEATGKVLVSYMSVDPGPKQGWEWTRTLENFMASVPRFELEISEG